MILEKTITKEEIQKRVLKDGKPLDLDKFKWCEELALWCARGYMDMYDKTFFTREDELYIDMSNLSDIHILCGCNSIIKDSDNAYIRCGHDNMIECGNNSDINCLHECMIECGNNCTIKCGYNSVIKCGSNCTIKCGNGCIINCENNNYIEHGTNCTINCGENCIKEPLFNFHKEVLNEPKKEKTNFKLDETAKECLKELGIGFVILLSISLLVCFLCKCSNQPQPIITREIYIRMF